VNGSQKTPINPNFSNRTFYLHHDDWQMNKSKSLRNSDYEITLSKIMPEEIKGGNECCLMGGYSSKCFRKHYFMGFLDICIYTNIKLENQIGILE
jgi:hypothetical protein